jgi:hypothetical protein
MSVTGKILSFTEADNGNMLMNLEFTLPDASVVQQEYNMNYGQLVDKDLAAITAWIGAIVKDKCERLLEAYVKSMVNQDIISKDLSPLVNNEYTKDKVVWKVTDTGQWVSEQLADTAGMNFVKRIDIDVDGKIVITVL